MIKKRRPKTILLDSDRNKIVLLYKSGKSLNQISIIYKIGIPAIHKILDKNNISNHKFKYFQEIKFSDEEISYIIDQFSEHRNLTKIAKHFNVSKAVIKRILAKNGIINYNKILDANKLAKQNIQKIIKLYSSGMNCVTIGNKFNIGYKKIKTILFDNNVKLRVNNGLNSQEQLLTKERNNKIIDLFFNKNLSYIDIAKSLKISKTTVFDVIMKFHKMNLICHNCHKKKQLCGFIRYKKTHIICNICQETSTFSAKIRRYKKIVLNAKNNVDKKLHMRISCSVRRILKLTGGRKDERTFTALGYSLLELRQHIENKFEPWMNWDNWGVYDPKTWNDNDPTTWKWQLDHIIPKSTLIFENMKCENFKKCWALSNLRPYSAKQNILDGAHKIRHGPVNTQQTLTDLINNL